MYQQFTESQQKLIDVELKKIDKNMFYQRHAFGHNKIDIPNYLETEQKIFYGFQIKSAIYSLFMTQLEFQNFNETLRLNFWQKELEKRIYINFPDKAYISFDLITNKFYYFKVAKLDQEQEFRFSCLFKAVSSPWIDNLSVLFKSIFLFDANLEYQDIYQKRFNDFLNTEHVLKIENNLEISSFLTNCIF